MAFSFLDVVRATLDDIAPESSFAPYLSQHNWIVADEIFKNTEDQIGGMNHKWGVGFKEGTSTKYVAPAAVRNPTTTEYTVIPSIPLVTTYFEVAHVERELLAQRGAGAKAIVDVLKRRRQAEQLGHYKTQESKFFAVGGGLEPYGLPYHIKPITDAQCQTSTKEGAFQGSSSDWCGINTSLAQYAGLQNWNANWNAAAATSVTMTAENKRRLSRMLRNLGFSGPMNVADLKLPAFSKFRLMADQYIIEALEAAAVSQNDQLGNDVLKNMGTGVRIGSTNNGVVVNGLPVAWVESLDTYSASFGYHPLIAANLDYIKVIKDPACWMKKRPAATDAVHQPDVIVEYIDSLFNYKCVQPRYAGGMISYVRANA